VVIKLLSYFYHIYIAEKSSLEIVHDKEVQQNALVVQLSEFTKGVLTIPLVPVYAEGYFEFSIGRKIIKLNGNQYHFSDEESKHALKITKVKTTSKVYYKINPKLNLFQKNNQIRIYSSDSLSVKSQYNNLKNLEFVNSYYLLDKFNKRHYQYLNYTMNIKDDEIILYYLLREYAKFLSLDSTCGIDEKKELMENFNKRFTNLIENKLLTKEHLQNYYPILVYNIFITERYGNQGELRSYYFD
jgi:hypothetical protein